MKNWDDDWDEDDERGVEVHLQALMTDDKRQPATGNETAFCGILQRQLSVVKLHVCTMWLSHCHRSADRDDGTGSVIDCRCASSTGTLI